MSSRKKSTSGKSSKINIMEIMECVLDVCEKDSEKIGVLLCEGDENSIDKIIYSAIFPNLYVFPMQSCTTVVRALGKIRKHLALHNLYAFGIIDRDALSKVEVKRLYSEKQVYTTKLPFIENMICAPEVIELLCEDLGLDYQNIIEKIEEQLIKILWQKMKEALPINLGIEKNEKIENLRIGASTKNKKIEKHVNRENILYAYRSKIIVSVVANAMHIDGRNAYYEKIRTMIDDEKYRDSLIKIMSKFVPKFTFYDLNEF